MTISFKQFSQLVDLNEDEHPTLGEGLSDMPGFGWLKGKDNSAKLKKIDAERAKLKSKRDEKSKAMDAEFAKIKAHLDSGGGKKGTIGHDDLDRALPNDDKKFNAKTDKLRDAQAAHIRKNLGISEAEEMSSSQARSKLSAIAKKLDGQARSNSEDETKAGTMPHSCRYKEWDESVEKKELYWITQESRVGEAKTAAELLAKELKAAGFDGWTVKVTIRDHYSPPDNTKWQATKKVGGMNEEEEHKGPVTIQGRKGMKSTPFEKTFKNQAALEKWMEKHGDDVSIDRYEYPKVSEAKYNIFGIMVEGVILEEKDKVQNDKFYVIEDDEGSYSTYTNKAFETHKSAEAWRADRIAELERKDDDDEAEVVRKCFVMQGSKLKSKYPKLFEMDMPEIEDVKIGELVDMVVTALNKSGWTFSSKGRRITTKLKGVEPFYNLTAGDGGVEVEGYSDQKVIRGSMAKNKAHVLADNIANYIKGVVREDAKFMQ